MATISLINGPNLNLLGSREPTHYGAQNLQSIQQRLTEIASQAGHQLICFQSNAEHELVDRVQASREAGVSVIVLNPAAFTHTSVALRDALLAVDIPFIEVHLSNVHAREAFRKHSYFSDIAQGVICGFGAQSYELAMAASINLLKSLQSK